MLNISSLFNKNSDKRLKDNIAAFLKTTPEKLAEFEEAYQKAAIQEDASSENFFSLNSRSASNILHESFETDDTHENLNDIVTAIVDALTEQTPCLTVYYKTIEATPLLQDVKPTGITNADLRRIPMHLRPQLTDELMQVDVSQMSCEMLLQNLMDMNNAKNIEKKQQFYHIFRQGLDILDLDPITYQILGKNRNSMGYWLTPITNAVNAHEFFKIPETKVVKVPLPILQLTRLDYQSLTSTTIRIVNEWAMKAFNLDTNKTYFIKTGTYSSKFDFRNAKVTGEKEVRELGEYLLFIHHQASMMASPLSSPCIYGASTTNEWVVREFIEDKENNPCIYKGMPLHTEYRVFVDFDTNEILGIAPYWDPETMKKRFSEEDDAASPHQRHDYIIYKMHEETLMTRYNNNKALVLQHVEELLPNCNLEGQWSIDIMQNGDDFWLIDMATADTSALQHYVPQGKIKKQTENWLPA